MENNISYVTGDIVKADVDIVVNAANGVGYLGGILARKWRMSGVAQSINYETKGAVEKEVRRRMKINRAGEVFFTNGCGVGRIGIIHAVTMMFPGMRTGMRTVEVLLPRIMELAEEKGAESLALTYLGCGVGGLKKEKVRDVYEKYFSTYEGGIKIKVYEAINNSNRIIY